ncbi:MAG: hypothetical protein HY089_05160, partial [Ignavibacteriales bacterium]|nr:hypothetical protein [Ignavibacteriales bacterium]
MKKNKYLSHLIILLVFSTALGIVVNPVLLCRQAKHLPVNLNQPQYIMDSWQTEQGLPQNSINAIVQTRDGYIWLATHDGLVRFNGVEFKIYNMENTPALKSNRMISLREDTKGNLWVGTENGGLTRLKEGVFATFTLKEGLTWDIIPSVTEDKQGTLWVGTSAKGVIQFKDEKFSTPYSMKNGLADNAITHIYPDSKGNVWIGTGVGLNRITDDTVYSYKGVPPANIPAIREDKRGRLWVGTFEGLVLIDGTTIKRFTKKNGLPDDRIHALLLDQDSILWVGTWKGLVQFNTKTLKLFSSIEGFSNDVIKSIYKDRESNIWVGTDGGGLRRLKKKILNVYTSAHGLSGDAILGICQDRRGAMWIGTNCYGLNKFENGKFTTYTQEQGLSNNCVWGLWEDHEGSIWAGTWSMGVNQYKDGQFIIRTEAEGLSNNVVFAIYEDRERNMWIGTANGLNKFKDGTFTIYNTADGLPHRNIRVIHEDRQGNLWVGTYGGLAKMKDGKFTSFTTDDGLSNNYVRAIYEDSDGVLWIGTYGGGLNRFKDGKFTVYNTANGLFDNGVFQILEDANGNFWMSSNKGIFRVSKDELNSVALGKKIKVTCFAYGKTEGMLSVECNGGFQSAGWKANDGRFWFPTVKGVVVVDPSGVTTNMLPPPMVIEQLTADGADIPLTNPISIEPGKDRFEFHYAGLSFTASEKVVYQYMLEGYDKTWVDAGNQRVAHYTNIPPGSYTFLVKAANEDGVWSKTPAGLRVELLPFFYQTKTFLVLCGMAVLFLSVGFYLLRVRHLVRLNLILEKRVNHRTEEIVEQKNKLTSINDELSALLTQLEVKSEQLEIARFKAEEANNAKSEFLAVVSHELRTPLNSVIGFANILRKNKF